MNGPFSAFFAQGLYVNIFVLVSVVVVSLCNHKGAGILSWSFSSISVACLILSSILHSALACFTCHCIQDDTVRCWLAYLSVFLRMVAATFLLLLLDPVRHLVVILPLSLLVLVLLGPFLFMQKRHTKEDIPIGTYWQPYEKELKLGFNVSSQVVTFAFAGLLGTVIGYVKDSSSNQVRLSGLGYMPSNCFLSYSILLGLLVQLLSTVTPYIRNSNIRKRMAKVYLRMVAYTSLMFLVLASVMAAEEILQEWVFMACFIIVIFPVLFFWLENRQGPDYFKDENDGLLRWCFRRNPTTSVGEEQDYDKASQIILGFITSLFAALMASNSKYSNERGGTAVSLSGWFKCSVLLELYGVLSYAVGIVVFSEMPDMKRFAFPKMVWTLSSIATTTVTIILMAIVGRLHPDEIKNIF